MPRPSGCHTTVDERVRGRRAVLAALTNAPEPMTVADLARHLRIHPNTARAHLAALISAGQVGRSASITSRPGRPTLRYVAIPGMDPGGIRHYRTLASVMTEELATEPNAAARMVAVGRVWGRRLAGQDAAPTSGRAAAIGRAVDMLDQLGFDPVPVDDTTFENGIGLRHCPFLEIAQVRPQVICALHLGMVQGLLAADSGLGERVTATGIVPFAQPNLCVITLGGPADRAGEPDLVHPGAVDEQAVHPEPEASA